MRSVRVTDWQRHPAIRSSSPRGIRAADVSSRRLGTVILLVSFGLLSFPRGPTMAETEIRSGPARVMLVELFTSQGCSSCPPADRWLSRLVHQPGLWSGYVPLAFHVDYWDYIGWQDPFANAAFSDRQRQYARQGGLQTVYTPGFLVDGNEWRQWHSSTEPPAATADAGELSATIGGARADVRYRSASPTDGSLVAHVALLGFGLVSDVSSGENSGRRLRNDFVVLALESEAMILLGDRHVAKIDVRSSPVQRDRLAIAVWISDERSLAPLQSAGAWIDDQDLASRALSPIKND